MTKKIAIRSGEHGVVRVFHLSENLAEGIDPSDGSRTLAAALGVQNLGTQDVQIVELDAIAEMGLTDFLRAGYDIDDVEIEPGRGRLDTWKGVIAVIRSTAFGGQAVELSLSEDISLIGTYHEQNAPPASFGDLNELQSDAAKGTIAAAGADESRPRPRGQSWLVWIGYAFVLAVILFIFRIFYGS